MGASEDLLGHPEELRGLLQNSFVGPQPLQGPDSPEGVAWLAWGQCISCKCATRKEVTVMM